MDKEWVISIKDNIGFSNYKFITIEDIIEYEDCYNITTMEDENIFLDKKYISIFNENNIVYRSESITVMIELVS